MASGDPHPGQARPTAVTVAVWLLMAGAGLLVAGGLLTASVNFTTLRQLAPATVADQSIREALLFYRGAGILAAAAGAALALFSWRTRRGDVRARRAAMSLGLAVVVLVGVGAVFAGTHILTLLSLPLVIVGALLLGRPATAAWFAGDYPSYAGHSDLGEEPQFVEYPEFPRATASPEHSDKPEYPEYPVAPEYPEYPEYPETPEYRETPGQPDVPESPDLGNPGVPDPPDVPENPESRGG